MIKIKDVQVRYGDFIAVDNVNFTIEEGEFFTLLGPSGSGKTTTLRAIAGFNEVSKGDIIIDGKSIVDLPVEKRELGMVFQSYALFPTMTVFENIAYGLRVEKKSEAEITKRVNELAEMVELSQEQLQRNVSDLSGGQQQRVAIARALAKEPSTVLFDEPLSNLDAKLRKQLRAELKEIQRKTGMTAIYVTHDQEEALELSDNIAVFSEGKVEQVGTPTEIYDKPATEFVMNFIGDVNTLGSGLMSEVNKQLSNKSFQTNRNHYIREEKVRLSKYDDLQEQIELQAKVVDETFSGSFIKYRLEAYDTKLNCIVKNDGDHSIEVGDTLSIYFDPDHILEFEV